MFGFFSKRKDPYADVDASQLEGELWVVAGQNLGERWRLVEAGDEYLVGRHLTNENDISFDNSATTVSKRHCIIRKTDDGFELEDLNSSNGTFLNKKKVKGIVDLITGDEIIIGLHESTIKFTVVEKD